MNKSEIETVMNSFSLLAQQLIYPYFLDDLEQRTSFEMICKGFENNFKLITSSQQKMKKFQNYLVILLRLI